MAASPILSRYSDQGAVPGPDPGDDLLHVAWHFGDPLGEQRAAQRTAVVIDRSDRAVIEIPGADRLTWLHTISSQHVAALPDRHSAENPSLDLNGRVEEHFVLTDIDGITWIDCEGSRGGPLTDFLTKMVFWAKAEPAARPDMAVLTLIGPDIVSGPVAELLELTPDAEVYTAGSLPELHHEDEPLGFWRVMPGLGDGGRVPVIDLVVPDYAVQAWWGQLTELGVRMAGTWAHDAMRVAALRPRLGVDTDERTIPHEVNWIGGPEEHGAVHLDKGCYRGQETVARVHNTQAKEKEIIDRWRGMPSAQMGRHLSNDVEPEVVEALRRDQLSLGGEQSGQMFQVCAGNTEFAAGGVMRISPGARPDDGLLNISLVDVLGRLQIVRRFPSILSGRYVEDERVDYFTGKRLEIDAVPPAEFQADGDIIGTTPATIELLPGTLKLVVQDQFQV